MKVLFVTDLHYSLKQFDWVTAHADCFGAVILGGDLLDLGSALDFDVQIVVIEKYLRRIREKTQLVVSSGNHDGDNRNAADESISQWVRDAKAEGLFVDGDSFELGGALVTICPWWDGPVSRGELEEQLTRAAEKRWRQWIWVHHAPPANSPVCWTGRKHGGDDSLRQWIERFTPDVVLSGHIHNAPFVTNGSWVDRIGKTWVFNPGRQIGASPAHLALDLDAMSVEWISIEGRSVRRLALADG